VIHRAIEDVAGFRFLGVRPEVHRAEAQLTDAECGSSEPSMSNE
jgi:hypothetical protein